MLATEAKTHLSMNRRLRNRSLAGAAAVALTAAFASVAPPALADGSGEGEHHHTPPPEAYSACDGKADGDACTFTRHDHARDGTCRAHEGDSRLSCRPKHPPIPQAAIDACSGKKVDDACTVSLNGHTKDGTCHDGPNVGLHCRPAHAWGGHHGEGRGGDGA